MVSKKEIEGLFLRGTVNSVRAYNKILIFLNLLGVKHPNPIVSEVVDDWDSWHLRVIKLLEPDEQLRRPR